MVVLVLKLLSNSNKYYCLTKLDNNHTANISTSNVQHKETEISAIKSIQSDLSAITPVNAGSLYWLI